MEQKKGLLSIMEDAPLEAKLTMDVDPVDGDEYLAEVLRLSDEIQRD